jgi:2-C-methyl-D-erythritol 4-phosphate cytidylyltransferase
MTKSVIITAGGIGKRMGADIPKQFMNINKRPILMHTIALFDKFDKNIEIIVVLPKAHIEFWQGLIKEHSFKINHTIIEGGKERFHSIKNGLKAVTGTIVAVHDGVRPFVSQRVLVELFNTTINKHAVIPVINLKESIRQINGNDSKSVNRADYKIVQTPQCFTNELIQKAYLQPYSNSFTDDASVIEQLGHKIHLIEGNDENIKITTPMDLKLAEILARATI